MDTRMRLRFWMESALGTLSTLLALVTVVHKDWIETVFGIDPDQHSGTAEWLIIFAALAIAATSVTLARREWTRRQAVAA